MSLNRDGEPGGLLYARTTGTHGEDIRLSLGHRDREQAKAYALEQAGKLRHGCDDIRAGRLFMSRLFALYALHRTPGKTLNEQNEDGRRTKMWTRVLGAQKDAAKITRSEWERFADMRASGQLDAQGEHVPNLKLRRPVRPRSVQRDMLWLKWVLNWGTSWQDSEGRYLLTANPVRGFDVPHEKNPRRPVASTDLLEKVLAAAETLEMELRWGRKARRQRAYIADILVLAAEIGRRISAILALRWDDVVWEARPHGAIRWRAETAKMGHEWTAPVSAKASAVLDRLRRERPGVGTALLFPSPINPEVPVSYERVRCWLAKAEKLAGVSNRLLKK